MPNITNVVLNIQHGGTGNQRTIRVAFTSTFNQVEVLNGIVFRADVKLTSNDHDHNIGVGTLYIPASNGPITKTLLQNVPRAFLDEDRDIPPRRRDQTPDELLDIENLPDEWFANVTLSPVSQVIIQPASADSSLVTGSWGIGQD